MDGLWDMSQCIIVFIEKRLYIQYNNFQHINNKGDLL